MSVVTIAREQGCRKAGAAARVAVLLIGLVLALSGASAPALADGPASFSSPNPTPGAMIVDNPRPTTSVRITDPAGISSATMNVDGSTAAYLYLDYPIGHWEDDGCDMWWVVDDYSVVDVRRVPTAVSPRLSVGSHTVSVSATNALGQVSTYSWQFGVDYTPSISSVSPVVGQVVTTRFPDISVVVNEADADPVGVMTLNGEAVTLDYDPGTRTFTHDTVSALEDGGHYTVSFTVTDGGGLSATRTWSFEIATTTVTRFRDALPAPGATLTALPVSFFIRADDPYVYLSNTDTFNTLLVDGVARPTVRSYPIGHWEDDGCDLYFVPDDLTVLDLSAGGIHLTDGTHTASARVRTTSMVTSETAWDFTVAVPPTVSDPVPAQGTSSLTPTISVRISDNSPGPYAATMTVNGIDVPVAVDPGTGVASYTPAEPLPAGQQTSVSIRATDAAGLTTDYAWAFLVDPAAVATFSYKVPAADSTIGGSSTTITAQASSAYTLVSTSARLWLDGMSKATIGSQPWPTLVNLAAPTGTMLDGPHTVRAQVTDVNGVASESEWSFIVAAPPAGTALAPANLSIVKIARPQIGLNISDNNPGPLNVRLTLNGATVVDEPRPQGVVRWTPPGDLPNGSTNLVAATITDAAGLTRTYNWRFTVTAAAPMSDGNQCATCHPASAHAFTPCEGCHQSYTGYDPHDSNPAAPMGECGECHGEGPHTAAYISNCAWCHTGAWPQIPAPHSAAALDPAHISVTPECTSCHSGALAALHGEYPTGTDFKYQCATCHASARPEVRAAITASDTRCTSCHVGDVHGAVHVSALDPRCVDCHEADVSAEHADACPLCHDSADPVVTGAIASGDLACAACHGITEHYSLHDGGFASGEGCEECHAANISDEHLVNRGLTCDVCHGVDAPAGVASVVSGGSARSLIALGVSGSGDESGAEAVLGVAGGIVGIAEAGAGPEDVWEAMAAGDTSCFACHTSFHGDMLPLDWRNSGYSGYLSWAWVAANVPGGGGTPHGGYATSTVKCAVCHAAHRASGTGTVLTAWPGVSGSPDSMTPYQSCLWCHGTSSPLFAASTIGNTATLSPHGYCGRCHTESVHGAGGSAYPVLRAKVINDSADTDIAADIAAVGANVAIDMTSSLSDGAMAVGTGYLCGSCHTGAVAFPVTASGFSPAQGKTGVATTVTGHRIIADVTTSWNSAGEYGVYYSDAGTAQVAFNPVTGCRSCHDARLGDQATGQFAFPHNYVNSVGEITPKTDLGSSYIWLSTAGDADEPRSIAGKTQAGSGDIVGFVDGLCLKCHRSGDATSGVGTTY